MINAEKYKNELLKVINENEQDFIAFDDRDKSIKNCTAMVCEDCKFSRAKAKVLCTQTKFKWLLSEYKEPTKLNRLEYELLKFWNVGGYKYIARDRDKRLFVYKEKPSKKYSCWGSMYGHHMLNDFVTLFQFVKWEDKEATSIKDVLENCVIENIKEEQ
jgi:hypothetical protein